MDRQEITLLVLLGLSSVFDTIDYSTMGNILENDFGITGSALSWLMSFLSLRQQCVVIDNAQSRYFPLPSGVPQDSCLGSILFILYASRLFYIYATLLVLSALSELSAEMLLKPWKLPLLILELGWQVIIFHSMTRKPNLSSLDLSTSF